MYNTTRDKMGRILSLYRLIPFSLLLFVALFISDIDECSKNSHNCSYTTSTYNNTKDRSSAFVNLDSVVMDTTAQVLNTTDLEHDNLSHHRNKPRRLVEVESLYKLSCYY